MMTKEERDKLRAVIEKGATPWSKQNHQSYTPAYRQIMLKMLDDLDAKDKEIGQLMSEVRRRWVLEGVYPEIPTRYRFRKGGKGGEVVDFRQYKEATND